MPIFKIHHVTKYEYEHFVKESSNEIKIYPYACKEQEVLQHEVSITNSPDVQVYKDYWGNGSGMFQIVPLHQQIIIESKLTIRTHLPVANPLSNLQSWPQLAAAKANNMLLIESATPDAVDNTVAINLIIAELQVEDKSIAQVCQDCNQYIFKNFKYTKGITTVETTVDEILDNKAGVCQDFAHLMLQILRTLGIPCRYVSGYICPNKNGMRGEGATHAWVEVFVPEAGWLGIDPTNNVWVTDNHVKLAVGLHFTDCTPVKGVFKGLTNQKLSVFVAVGYEDGQVFEEVNDVNMNFEVTNGKPVKRQISLIDSNHQQQQQQQ